MFCMGESFGGQERRERVSEKREREGEAARRHSERERERASEGKAGGRWQAGWLRAQASEESAGGGVLFGIYLVVLG